MIQYLCGSCCNDHRTHLVVIQYLWTGTESQLSVFYDHCNSFHKSIKFTIEYSTEKITFLDTVVHRNKDGKLVFDLYCKPTDKHCYLHFQSNHPHSQKLAGPYSQYLHIRRICSNLSDFEKHAENLTAYYIRRGYPQNEMHQSLERARLENRESLLQQGTRKNSQQERTPFVLTHDRDIHHFKKAMLQLWPLLQITHPRLFSEPPVFAMKIGNKISQTLIRANFSTKTRGTSGQIHRYPVVDCTDAQYKYCTYIRKSKIFRSSYTNYWYQSKLRGHCTTRNLITCSQYKKQYVGETKREIKVRMTEHQRDTRNKRDTPVANHFNLTNHSIRNMRFQIIEILPLDPESEQSTVTRKTRELHWIYQLHTLRPVRINVHG